MKMVIGPDGVRHPVTADVERFLRSMDRDALQSLVLEMATYSPEAMRSLQLRATPEDEPTVSELLAAVDAALAGVDLDYHDPFHEDVDDGRGGRRRTGAAPRRRRPPRGATSAPAPAHPARRPGTGRRQRRRPARSSRTSFDTDRTRGRRKRNWGITVLGAVADLVSKHAFGCLPVNLCLNDGSTVKPERVHVWGGEQSRPATLRASCRPPERKATMVTV